MKSGRIKVAGKLGRLALRFTGFLAWMLLFSLLVSCAGNEGGAETGSGKAEKTAEELVDEALHGESADVRLEAARELKESGDEGAVEALRAAALNPELGDGRVRAVRALGVIGSDGAVDALMEVVGQTDHTDVRGDLSGLGSAGEAFAAASSEEDEYVRSTAEQALADLEGAKEADLEIVAGLWLDKLQDLRCYAIHALAETGSEYAARSLVTVIKNQDAAGAAVTSLAADAMIKIGSANVEDDLIALFNDKSLFWPRRTAAKILGEIGGQRSADALLAEFWNDDDSPEYTWFIVADALERLGERLGDEQAKYQAHRYDLYSTSMKYKTYIEDGDEEMIPLMIESLNAFGSKQMAEAFLNCGNPRLESAARKWAQAEGYEVTYSEGGGFAGWGSGR